MMSHELTKKTLCKSVPLISKCEDVDLNSANPKLDTFSLALETL